MSKLSKRAISTLVIAIFLLSSIFATIPISIVVAHPAVTITEATGGGAISADDTGVTWTTLGPIVITEGAIADIAAAAFVLTLPAGFEFDTVGTAPDVAVTGTTIAVNTPAVMTATTLTVTVTAASTVADGVLTIGGTNPIMVRPDTGTLASGDITMTAGTIAGVTIGTTNFGTLTMVSGAASQLAFTTEPSSTGYVNQPFTVQPVVEIQDIYGNLVTSTATVALTEGGAGTLTGTISKAAVAGVATFTNVGYTGLDTITITATSAGLIDAVGTTPITLTLPTSDFTIDYVTSGNVDYGKTLTVIGSGVTSGSTVNVYWDFVTAANLLNATTGKPSGEFECTVKVPSAYYGNHYIWVKDLASGISIRSAAIPVVSKIKLSPSSGLKNDNIIVKGYGFLEDSDVNITFTGPETLATDGEDETDDLGYFEYTFKVLDVSYDEYTVTANDEDLNEDDAIFTVGSAITLDKTVGPAGTIVKVDGRGFTAYTTINNGTDIFLDGFPVSTKDGKNVTASSTGAFTVYIVIPSVSEGDYEITIDDGPRDASAEFEVDGETSIEVTPGYGTPGTVLIVKGYNFTRISGTVVNLALMDQLAEAKTDASGSFTATIIIPPLGFGDRYPVIANDTRLCHAEDEVLVALIVLQLSEYSAPVGSEIMLMGSGFTENKEWNATIGDIDLIEDTGLGSFTYFSKKWWVPSLPAGTYTIHVRDIEEKIVVGIDFTVTDPAALSISRAAIPNKYNLTIEGTNFVEMEGVTTQWWLYNSTHEWNLNEQPNVTYGGPATVPTTDKDGEFTGYYKIPEFLALGSYCINCTTISNNMVDPDVNQTAEICFDIVPEEIVINVGGPSYARGQTITFIIKTTLKKEPFYLGIKDPEGSEFFNSTWELDDWKTLGSWFYIPSNLQIDYNTEWLYTLPTDATPGTWTYSFWDEDKEYANGTFQVTYLTEIEQLQQDIGELAIGMEGIGTSVIDLATTVAGVSGAAAEAVAAAAAAATAAAEAQAAAEAGMAAVEDVGDTAQDALDAANDAKSAADRAKDAADSSLAAANDAKATSQAAKDAADKAAKAAETTQKQTSGLTTLVYGAIGASLIAALAAIVSLMQISRRIAG